MERSRQKTFNQQRTNQFIIALLVFNTLNYPARLSADQFNGILPFKSGDIVGTAINCRVGIKPKVDIKALVTTGNRKQSSHTFIPDFPTHLACMVIFRSVPFLPNDTDCYNRIHCVSSSHDLSKFGNGGSRIEEERLRQLKRSPCKFEGIPKNE